jgi:hypothetical protein
MTLRSRLLTRLIVALYDLVRGSANPWRQANDVARYGGIPVGKLDEMLAATVEAGSLSALSEPEMVTPRWRTRGPPARKHVIADPAMKQPRAPSNLGKATQRAQPHICFGCQPPPITEGARLAQQFTGRLWDFGGDKQRHRASFTLAYDGDTRAHITIWVERPSPTQGDLATAYAPLLDRLGEIALQAAAAPQALSWPDRPQRKQQGGD